MLVFPLLLLPLFSIFSLCASETLCVKFPSVYWLPTYTAPTHYVLLPMHYLLSAFEPFAGAKMNASQAVAHRVAARDDRAELLLLPVVRFAAPEIAVARLRQAPAPPFFLALGEAGRERMVFLEKVAINWDNFRIADNAGNQPRDAEIIPHGPDAHFATLPVADISDALAGKTPLPVAISLSAGTFVCNHLAYSVADFLTKNPVSPFCFIHVPAWRPEDGPAFLGEIVETVQAIIVQATLSTSKAR